MKLNKISTLAPKKFAKEKTKKELQKLKFELEELQNLLFAEGKHSILIIIQGMDASGKDGAVKNVFEAVNPMGCRVTPFKEPSELEKKHDFLWRVHPHVPEKGMIQIFNRSHYEAVLVERIHELSPEKMISQRYAQINDFERLLKQTETHVLKFYMHVSKEEQLKRLNERLSDPSKMWKHDDNDIKERDLWKDYMHAYEDVFEKCSEIEWHIVPSDQNWFKEYYIAKKVVELLRSLDMKYPGLKK
ncbi:MAG: polyphosphate kinase [Bacteroidetes bacterium]|nr:polyphosphate kinase [Bacteroidota bacterium]